MALEFLTLSTHPASHELLHGILKQVSRSFYLTLNVLPDGVRDQMGLSYLFARAADTIADTDLIDRAQRLKYLNRFRNQFKTDAIDWQAVQRFKRLSFLIRRIRGKAFCCNGWKIVSKCMKDSPPTTASEFSG